MEENGGVKMDVKNAILEMFKTSLLSAIDNILDMCSLAVKFIPMVLVYWGAFTLIPLVGFTWYIALMLIVATISTFLNVVDTVKGV